MAFPQIGLEAVAELDAFLSAMQSYNNTIDSAVDATSQAASGMSSAIDGFVARATEGAMEATVVFGGLGASLTAVVTKAAFSAARIEELETVLALAAKTAGYTQDEVANMVATLEKQGIASTTAREGVLRVMQAQMDLSTALGLAEAAQDLAIVGQQESTKAYEDFIQATVTGNTMILRKYGIMATGTMMYDDYAASIATTTQSVIDNSEAIADLSAKLSVQHAQLDVQGEKLAKAREEGKKSEAELALMQARYDDLSLSISQNEQELSSLAASHGQLAESSKASGKELMTAQKQMAIAKGIIQAAIPVQGAYNEAMTTASKNFRSLPRLIETVTIAFGQGFLPIFKDVIFTAKDLLSALGNLDKQTWQTISNVVGLAAAISTAVGAAGGLVFTIPKIAAALSFLTGPLGLVAVAVGALAYAFIVDFGGIRETIADIVDGVKNRLVSLMAGIDNFRDSVNTALGSITKTLIKLGSSVTPTVKALGHTFQFFVESIAQGFREGNLAGALDAFVKSLDRLFPVIQAMFKRLGRELLSGFLEIAGLPAGITKDLGTTVDAFLSFSSGVMGAVESVIVGVARFVLENQMHFGRIQQILEVLSSTFQFFFGQVVQGLLRGGVNEAIAVFTGYFDRARTLIATLLIALGNEIATLVGNIASILAERLASWGQALIGWIAPRIPALLEGLRSLADAVLGWVGDQAQKVAMTLASWGEAFIEWVSPYISKLVTALGKLSAKVLEWIREQAPGLLKQLAEWGEGLVSWVSPYVSRLLDELGKLSAKVLEWIREQAPGLLKRLAEWGEIFVEWISPYISKLVSELNSLASRILGWVTEQVPDFFRELAKWGRVFVDWVSPHVSKLIAELAKLADQVLSWVAVQAPGFVKELVRWGKAFIEWVSPHISKLITELGKLASKALAWIAEQTPGFLKQLAEWGKAFVDWVSPRVSELLNKLRDLAGKVISWIAEQAPGFLRQLVEWGKTFVEWVGPRIVELLSNLADLGKKVLGWIGEQIPKLAKELARWGSELIGWVGPKIPVLLSELADFGKRTLNWIVETVPKLADKLLRWGTAFIEWIGPKIPVVLTELGNFLGKIIQWILGTAIPSLIEKTAQLAVALVRWITDPTSGAIAKAPSALSDFLAALGRFVTDSLIPGVIGFGAGIVQGFLDGMTEGVDRLWNDIMTVGQSIIDGIGAGLEAKWGELKTKIDGLIGKLPQWAREILGAESPSQEFIDIAIDMARGLLIGWEQGMGEVKPDFVKVLADAISSIAQALGEAFAAFTTIGSSYTGGNLKSVIDRLINDVRYVLTKVRTELLDLWGWAGERKDTVWGHMVDWADAVGGVVELVGRAAESFTRIKDYQGILPDAIDALVADIQEVAQAIIGGLEVGGVDDLKAEWLKFSTELIGLAAGVIDDMNKLASFEGGLKVSQAAVTNLVESMELAAQYILMAVRDMSAKFDEEGNIIPALEAVWLEFTAGLISTIAGVIDNLQTLSGFEGGLEVSREAVTNLIESMELAAKYILMAVRDVSAKFDEEGNIIPVLEAVWLEFTAGLISTIAGVIDNLQTLSGFEGELEIGKSKIMEIMQALKDTANAIGDAWVELGAIPINVYYQAFYDVLQTWITEHGRVVGALADVVDSLQSLSEFEPGLAITSEAVAEIMQALRDTANSIGDAWVELGAIPINVYYQALYDVLYTWITEHGKVAVALANVIESLSTLSDFEGGLNIARENVDNLMTSLQDVAGWILEAIGQITSDFQQKDSIDALKTAWLEFNAGLVSALSGVIENVKAITKFEGGLAVSEEAVRNLVEKLEETVSIVLGAVGQITSDFQQKDSIDALKAAWLDFSAGLVSTIAGVIEDIGAIAALEGPLAVNSANVQSVVSALNDAVGAILAAIGDLSQFDEGAMTAAKTFAETAGAAVALIADGVEAFVSLADYVEPDREVMGDFADAVGDLVEEFRRVAGRFDTDMLAAAKDFADTAGSVVGLAADGLEVLADLADYGGAPVSAIKRLAADMDKLIAQMAALAKKIDKDGLEAAKAFSESAVGIFEFMGEAVGALSDLSEYEGVSTRVFRDLSGDIHDAMDLMQQLAADIDAEMLEAARNFSEKTAEVLVYIASAMAMMVAIGEYSGIGNVWRDFKGDVEDAFARLPEITEIVQGGEVVALSFKEAMESVMGNVMAGFDVLAGLDAIAFPDWPASDLQASLDELAGMGEAAIIAFAENIQAISTLQHISDAFVDVQQAVYYGYLSVRDILDQGFVDLGYQKVCEFSEGIKEAITDCVNPAFDALIDAVKDGVQGVNDALDNLGVSSPKFQSLHELNAELMRTATIAASALQAISLAAEPRVTTPLGAGGGATYNQQFYVNPTVTGNTYHVREEADIGRVAAATVEAMRESLGDITSRRERY